LRKLSGEGGKEDEAVETKTLNFFKKPGARIFARSTSFEADL
jgi:hypothetical protein